MPPYKMLRVAYFNALDWLSDFTKAFYAYAEQESTHSSSPSSATVATIDGFMRHAEQFITDILDRHLSKTVIDDTFFEDQWAEFFAAQLELIASQAGSKPVFKSCASSSTADDPLFNNINEYLANYIDAFYQVIDADSELVLTEGFKHSNLFIDSESNKSLPERYNKAYSMLSITLESLNTKLMLEQNIDSQEVISIETVKAFYSIIKSQRKAIGSKAQTSNIDSSLMSATPDCSAQKAPSKIFKLFSFFPTKGKKASKKSTLNLFNRKEVLRQKYFEGETWFDDFFKTLKIYTKSDEYENVVLTTAASSLKTTKTDICNEVTIALKAKIKKEMLALNTMLTEAWDKFSGILKANMVLKTSDLVEYKQNLRLKIERIVFLEKDLARYKTFILNPLDTRLMYAEHHYHDAEDSTTALGGLSRKLIKAFSNHVKSQGLEATSPHRITNALIDLYARVNIYIGILYMLLDPKYKQKIINSRKLLSNCTIPLSKSAITDDPDTLSIQLKGLTACKADLILSIEVFVKSLGLSTNTSDLTYSNMLIRCLKTCAKTVEEQCQYINDYLTGKACRDPEAITTSCSKKPKQEKKLSRNGHGKNPSLVFHEARISFDCPELERTNYFDGPDSDFKL